LSRLSTGSTYDHWFHRWQRENRGTPIIWVGRGGCQLSTKSCSEFGAHRGRQTLLTLRSSGNARGHPAGSKVFMLKVSVLMATGDARLWRESLIFRKRARVEKTAKKSLSRRLGFSAKELECWQRLNQKPAGYRGTKKGDKKRCLINRRMLDGRPCWTKTPLLEPQEIHLLANVKNPQNTKSWKTTPARRAFQGWRVGTAR